MNNLTISIFGNQTFLEIFKELKLFSKFKTKYYQDLDQCLKESENTGQLVIYLETELKLNDIIKSKNNNFPLIIITSFLKTKKSLSGELVEYLNMPFNVFDLYKKIISLIAKFEFKKVSLINLKDYIIDKNERKIKKNNIELQLTEKEINFLILFSQNKKPLSRNFVLKTVWNYSSKTDTHTVETHIHRLRKKILDKFDDKNFIKNDNRGYYI